MYQQNVYKSYIKMYVKTGFQTKLISPFLSFL